VDKGIFSWCASDKIAECNMLHTKPRFLSVLGQISLANMDREKCKHVWDWKNVEIGE
jgi:hypothetical protein